VIANIPPHEWHAELTSFRQVIGRGADADIRIPAKFASVSRAHAAIWFDRSIWLEDLASTAGTLVNGITIKPNKEYELSLADSLWLGGVELNVVADIDDGYVFDPHVVDNENDTRIPTDHELNTDLQKQSAATSLTHAELEVVLWISRGYTTLPELGQKLFRSPHTIRAQLRSIFRKLGIHSRDEVVAWFKRCKLSKELSRRAEKVAR
jgi:DNA-binding CsgD family transcriptional regulator